MPSMPSFNDPSNLQTGQAASEVPPNWANERRLRALMENLQSGVVIHAEDSRVLAANTAACRMLGLSLDQMRGKTAMDPHWRFMEEGGTTMPLARFPVQQVLATWQPIRDLVVGVQRAELADPIWVICTAYPEYDPETSSRNVVVTFSDVTELKRAKQLAVWAQEDLRATLQAVPDLMFEMAQDGTLLGYHSPLDRLIVSSPDEFLNRKVSEVLPPEAAAAFHAALQCADQVGHASGQQYMLEANGKSHWFELSVARKQGREQAHATYIVLSRDITDRKQAEAARQQMAWELAEAQRMESIGTLAGGIAHDFNNILAAILGNIAIAREEIAVGQSVETSLEQIQRASLRARSLVQQILSFSRHDRQGHQPHLLGPIVEETQALMRATLPAGVSLRVHASDEPLWALCDSTQIQQVLINLCTNAWQAFNGHPGVIDLSLQRCERQDALPPRRPTGLAGPCAHLRIADNGSGMDEDTLQRIFDPFFTTKPVGQGTGLGLSVVHGIVRAHGGIIEVESTPGVGSVFHIYLPLHQIGDAASNRPSDAGSAKAPSAPAATGCHILCIDDDQAVLTTVERLLNRAGYRVSIESSAAAGVARLQRSDEHFDAVITDYNMPEHSGLEVAAQVARIRPGLPLLMMSGLMPHDTKALVRSAGVTALLFKERVSDELLDCLARLLRQESAR